MDFLISKSIFTSEMAPEDFKCAVSFVEFANSLRKNIPKTKGLIPSTIVASLTLLDLFSMGNNCTFLQECLGRQTTKRKHGYCSAKHGLVLAELRFASAPAN